MTKEEVTALIQELHIQLHKEMDEKMEKEGRSRWEKYLKEKSDSKAKDSE
jgi:hypothetical protein